MPFLCLPIFALQKKFGLIVYWTNPADENFSHVRIIPSEFELAESELLDKDSGIDYYSMLDYLGVEYIIIKAIDKNGDISNGVKYYFDPKNNPDALTIAFECNGGSKVQQIFGLLGDKISEPDNPLKPGYSFDEWHKNQELTDVWDFNSDVITGDTTLYAKWLNVAPGEVEITDCVYKDDTFVVATYKLPGDVDLDYLIVHINGKLYYDHHSKNDLSISLTNILNGSVVSIKTVDTSGLVSSGIDYTIDIPGFTIATSVMELILSSNIIRKYPDRIDPPTISCSLRGYTNDGYVTLENIPMGWDLLYRISKRPVIDQVFDSTYEYTGPITVDSSWTRIEFVLYHRRGAIASKEIQILPN
jgi:uncharacterized repeat protein (TIGR02543 family)